MPPRRPPQLKVTGAIGPRSRKGRSAEFCTALLTADPNADESDEKLEALAEKHKKALDYLLASCRPAK